MFERKRPYKGKQKQDLYGCIFAVATSNGPFLAEASFYARNRKEKGRFQFLRQNLLEQINFENVYFQNLIHACYGV
ncbi:hypothetical protein [Desulfovibrio intestinalis]|uniref:Uncharacterized protein n=1 Tax=Desulfovibrio intestinalis TaxID=58621 RepID=A0A7W8FGN6_9BACT|nr:hypothetical protein [Desulfovibrio intestinalis]MBB5144126.1 hypothetical protein [Desulfovibrio intestinalis]